MRIAMLSAFLLLMLFGGAMARPRDEVMINAYGCAGHASARIWLDCYYGAAQPERAALGLAPAPSAQVQLVRVPSAPGVPQDIAVRDAVIVAAARCGSLATERSWLDCYYAAANPMRELLGLSVPGGMPAPPPDSKTMPVVSHRKSGLLALVFGAHDIAVVSHIADYNFDRNGIFTVTLENGEVWQQLDGDSFFAHWSKEPHNYAVTITNGAFKSFNLTVKGSPASYKVRRVS
jgi:hypothetical protein